MCVQLYPIFFTLTQIVLNSWCHQVPEKKQQLGSEERAMNENSHENCQGNTSSEYQSPRKLQICCNCGLNYSCSSCSWAKVFSKLSPQPPPSPPPPPPSQKYIDWNRLLHHGTEFPPEQLALMSACAETTGQNSFLLVMSAPPTPNNSFTHVSIEYVISYVSVLWYLWQHA